jgi:UDP-N-acetylmuramoyl-L-alanyl-D-glutamate--2,6-diaminopimelate ligase
MQNLFATLKGTEIHITSNSKEIKNGSVFVAKIGKNVDGHAFIKNAILLGATVVLHSKPVEESLKSDFPAVKFIQDENLEANLPLVLKDFYDLPSKIVAITGTNGKTSTAFLAASAFSLMGFKSGFIGTLGIFAFENGKSVGFKENPLTTPDNLTLFSTLNDFKKDRVEFVFFEASSIGIEQDRIAGIPLSACCFTNFTQDHLDYHITMENYFNAKALLFSKFLQKDGFAVLNKLSDKISKIEKICNDRGIKSITFNAENSSVFASNVRTLQDKIFFDCNANASLLKDCLVNLSGKFQLENILCVTSLALGFGLNMKDFQNILPLLKAPHGRLERIENVNPSAPKIFLDYAHTPDSLKQVLQTLRDTLSGNGKLLLLFGCGGDRDKIKRPLMGGIATEIADFTVITDDNPRNENPDEIRAQIISGMKNSNFKEISGREEAIKFIISIAKQGDFILLAGKGHEDYQIIGDKKLPFNEEEIAKKYLI